MVKESTYNTIGNLIALGLKFLLVFMAIKIAAAELRPLVELIANKL